MLVVTKNEVPDEEQRLVYAEVYAPNRPDSAGDFMTAEQIQKAAHDFVRKGRMAQVDVQHDNQLIDGVQIVESYIAQKDDPTFIPGSWVVGVHINDDDTWAKVKKGEINGFSLEAMAKCQEVEVEIEIPPVVTGLTSKSEEHTHKFYVAYDETGKFLGGQTSKENGHVHAIRAGTVTDEIDGHSHRFSSVDNVEIVG
jgi:hypothetical protein